MAMGPGSPSWPSSMPRWRCRCLGGSTTRRPAPCPVALATMHDALVTNGRFERRPARRGQRRHRRASASSGVRIALRPRRGDRDRHVPVGGQARDAAPTSSVTSASSPSLPDDLVAPPPSCTGGRGVDVIVDNVGASALGRQHRGRRRARPHRPGRPPRRPRRPRSTSTSWPASGSRSSASRSARAPQPSAAAVVAAAWADLARRRRRRRVRARSSRRVPAGRRRRRPTTRWPRTATSASW